MSAPAILPGWSTNPDDYEVVDGQLREIEHHPQPKGAVPVASATEKKNDESPAAEGGGTTSEKKGAVKRDYGVFQELSLDLSDVATLVANLQKVAGIAEGEEGGTVVVLARVGVGTGITPKTGLTAVAQDVELEGSYEVIASSSITHFENVKTKQARAVEIG